MEQHRVAQRGTAPAPALISPRAQCQLEHGAPALLPDKKHSKLPGELNDLKAGIKDNDKITTHIVKIIMN